MKKTIDHLIYCVPNLQEGMDKIENQFGVAPIYGGRHLMQGTHNALLNLGAGCYLELLAIDPENDSISAPRWMGIDLVKKPKMTRWAIKSTDFEREISILKNAKPSLATAFIGSRKTTEGSLLNWKMSLPQSHPEVEILPFLLDWKDSVHPTKKLSQQCQLLELYATHPEPQFFEKTLINLEANLRIMHSETVSLVAKIETPNGIFEI